VQLIVHHLKRTDIHFGLVGGGTELPAMKELAKQLGVEEYVTFTGRAPDAELLEMLNTADICVNPDRANDMNDRSTMNKIMEYMALGKPIVQFDLTEGRVSAGDASWYARPNDVADLAQKMVALLADENQRIHMGAVGRDRVERVLSWQHEAPRLLAAYDNLLGERT
jgi:glycosyltransferase involved in cell wall biosynthesis